MNLSIYVPKHLRDALRERARREKTTPSRFVQQLLKERLAEEKARFSEEFEALVGSWEDTRSVDAIVTDIRDSLQSRARTELR